MKIIAFDLGANMAWAHNIRRNMTVKSQIYKGDRPTRLAGVMNDLNSMFEDADVMFDVLVYETPFARGRDATRSLWGIAGVLEAVANSYSVTVLDVAVPTIKKFATGHGFAAKNEMILAAQKFGYVGSNEHEADAVCLLKYAEANFEKVVK